MGLFSLTKPFSMEQYRQETRNKITERKAEKMRSKDVSESLAESQAIMEIVADLRREYDAHERNNA